MLLIKPRIFNIQIDSSLNIFISLLPHLPHVIEEASFIKNIFYLRIFKFSILIMLNATHFFHHHLF